MYIFAISHRYVNPIYVNPIVATLAGSFPFVPDMNVLPGGYSCICLSFDRIPWRFENQDGIGNQDCVLIIEVPAHEEARHSGRNASRDERASRLLSRCR